MKPLIIFRDLNRIIADLYILLKKGCTNEAKNYLSDIKSFVNKDDFNQLLTFINFVISEDNVYVFKLNWTLFCRN